MDKLLILIDKTLFQNIAGDRRKMQSVQATRRLQQKSIGVRSNMRSKSLDGFVFK